MASFEKFQPFVEKLAEGLMDLGADQLEVALTNAANPPAVADGLLADLTEISYTALSARTVTTSTSTQTAGVYKLVCADLTITSSGSPAAFRYVCLFDQDAVGDPLIGNWDYGSDLALASGESLLIDFSAGDGVLQLT